MKKSFILLALSLTSLPLLAADFQRLNIAGYRIGDSEIMANADHRIVATNCNGEVKTDIIDLGDDRLSSNAWFFASVPKGEEVIRWVAYDEDPTPPNCLGWPPTQTNNFAGAVTEHVWSYNANDTADKYIVVDYDYITYTLKYNGNGSTSGSMSSESHIYTNNFNLASNQFSKTGYTFVGWATNETTAAAFEDMASVSGESFGVTYTNTTTKTATLYANWKPNTYTVTFDPCGGSVVPESTNVTYDAAWPILPTPTRDGYRFAGWFTAATGGTEINTNSTYATAANTTNYAHWAELVTATFKDGHTGETLKTETLDKGGTPTPPEAPEHAGYYSTGWAPAISAISVNTVFTMQYAQYSYTVVFHADNGTGAEQTQQFTYNAAEAPLNSVASMEGFLITGYNFQNWTNSAGNAYADGELVSNLAQSGEYHLYATWTPIAYTISFNGNGADSGSVGNISATYDVEYPLPDNGFARADRSFKAWRLGMDGDTYNVGDTVSNLSTTAGATVTFYAVWSEPRYIAFNGNCADNPNLMTDDVMTFEGVETRPLVSNKFERTGYTFVGWATNETTAAALDVTYTNCAEVVSTNLWMAIGETNVFFAVWQANKYTVVFMPNGGTGSPYCQDFFYDQSQVLSNSTFCSNLRFNGWATNETGGVIFNTTEPVSNLTAKADGEVILYAVWNNGDLSTAMDCYNLFWDNKAGYDWEIDQSVGYNQSSSSVCCKVKYPNLTSDGLVPSGATQQAGKLSFWYKTSISDKSRWLRINYDGDLLTNLQANVEWTKCESVYVDNIAKVAIVLSAKNVYEATVWIDQMTWVPDGQEPTDEDSPTISGFTKTTDGFALTVDQTNISDSFSYQILATNELVNGDWPVKETLTADELKAGYEIVIEENEPKMFYKVKVISK